MTHLRENFWILKTRQTIRRVINKCVRCRRFNSRKTEVIPAPLPEDRVREATVFEIVGIDLTGPLYLKGGNKAWIVIFTCAVYRTVHLELVTSLSTEEFLQTLRRFIARRGRPAVIYSDNGTNFVGANRALKQIDWSAISASVAVQRIKWKFNPPTAAWWGGWWERLIKMIKQILRKILGQASLNYEELNTVICECEQLMNSRPLTYVSEDTEELTPLTPSMFLQEIRTSGVPDIDILDHTGFNKRVCYRQILREHLRKRFRIEYLGQLRTQTFRHREMKPLSEGDVVLIEDDNKKRSHWLLARVLELYPGRDGYVRVARLKTSSGEMLRPVQRLYNLEIQNDHLSLPERGNSIKRTRSGRKVIIPERFR